TLVSILEMRRRYAQELMNILHRRQIYRAGPAQSFAMMPILAAAKVSWGVDAIAVIALSFTVFLLWNLLKRVHWQSMIYRRLYIHLDRWFLTGAPENVQEWWKKV